MAQQVRRGSGPKCPGFTSTRKTHHTRYDYFGRVIAPSQRPLPDNTQYSQDRHPCLRRGWNPKSQQVSDRRPTPPDRAATRIGWWSILYIMNYSTVRFNRLRILTGYWTFKSLICYLPLKYTKLKQYEITLTLYSRKSDSPNLENDVSHHNVTNNSATIRQTFKFKFTL
jgi:hypothetical protein